MNIEFPNLVAEIARKGIKKGAIAQTANMSTKTLRGKIVGMSDFYLREATVIRDTFFPDQTLEYLFERKP